jgi:hypothetical protein
VGDRIFILRGIESRKLGVRVIWLIWSSDYSFKDNKATTSSELNWIIKRLRYVN